ncbi:MAG: zinc ribbon domain-containing protein [bacterium]
MPIREYQCSSCETRFEQIELSASPPKPVCPSCGTTSVAKLFSAFAVGSDAGSSARMAASESGPCGSCGAAQRGACGMDVN